jgi:hypothetical protein
LNVIELIPDDLVEINLFVFVELGETCSPYAETTEEIQERLFNNNKSVVLVCNEFCLPLPEKHSSSNNFK